MLQNTRATALTVSELLRENQQGGTELPPPLPPTHTHTQIRVNFLGQWYFEIQKFISQSRVEEALIFFNDFLEIFLCLSISECLNIF